MKTKLLFFAICFLMIGCFSKDTKEQIAGALAEGISDALECSNQDAIKASVLDILGREDSVKKLKHGQESGTPIGEICKIGVSFVVPVIYKMAIPEKWECKATTARNLSRDVLNKLCETL